MPDTLTTRRLTTAVRERPFIAKPWEVRAMLENRMTQFRRPMKPQHIRCPFGSPGDRLWVKETWAPYRNRRISEQTYCKQLDHDGDPFVLYRADGTALEYVSTEQGGNCYPRTVSVNIDDTDAGRWHSPVSMPRWASRLTLEVTDVRAERVCEVSEDDAIDNGFLPHGNLGAMSARDWLIVHWDLDFPNHPWESSWSWAVTFRLIQTEASHA